MKKLIKLFLLCILLFPGQVLAHHGGVSLGRGPGSPIDTTAPLTLPEGGLVVFNRLEYVPFQKFTFAEPQNKDSYFFYNLGLFYGLKPYLSAGLTIPYSIKKQDSLGTNSGIGDIGLNALLGFNYAPGQGFSLNKAEDTAISMDSTNKTYFGLTGSVTFPTGANDMKLGGVLARDMQPGFGSPSFTLGISALKPISRNLALVTETSYQIFSEKDNYRFGNEWRLNGAGVYELYGKAGAFLQTINGILELNLLNLDRDTQNGQAAQASGGTVLYLSPGLRFSFPKFQNANLGFLIKFPLWKNLNEEGQQQGSEGLEKIRLILTLSFFF
jgi:hypothetical protein